MLAGCVSANIYQVFLCGVGGLLGDNILTISS